MKEYFREQMQLLKLDDSTPQLVQFITIDEDVNVFIDPIDQFITAFDPLHVKIAMTVNPHYTEVVNLEFVGYMKRNKIPVFRKKI